MDYRRADAIMQEVAQFVKGDFLINDDCDLTMAVARKLVSKSREYLGGIQSFGGQRMSCTQQCTRDQDSIVIGRDGVVFGPYCAFPAGKYIASFYVNHVQKDCNFIVESQQTGVICSVKAGEIQLTEDGIYSLEFSLPEKVEQLELKVHNPTDTPVVFHKVTITIPLGRMAAKEPQFSTEPIQPSFESTPMVVGDDACASILEELHSDQSVFARMMKDMGAMAECRPPQNTRYAFFKKVVRKIINSYVFFQVEFNRRLLQQQKNLVNQSRKLLDAVTALWSRQNSYEMRLAQLEQHVLTTNQQLAQWKALCNRQDEEISRYKGELSDIKETVSTKVQMLQDSVSVCERELHDTKEFISTQIQMIKAAESGRIDEIWEEISRIGHDLQCDQKNTESTIQQVQQSVDGKINDIWVKIKQIDDEFEGIWKHNQETNMNLDSVWRTYNTMRQEVFYEIDHRTRTVLVTQNETSAVVTPKILPKAAEKVARQGGKIRLNLGSGNLSVDGYLSVDARELSNVDVVADISKLPYEEGSVDEIFSAHLIEHFTKQRMEKELLPYWKSLLKSGGVFRVIFPDLEAMIKAYDAGEIDFNTLGTLIMGGQDYQLDYHYAVYSPGLVVSMLENAGFHNIQVVAQGRENGGCRETEIVAIK